MIPRIIHYCWFGRGPLSPLAERCIASWRQFLPDCEIRRWDEDNFDVRRIPYTAEAYDAGKYAFVSDYARFWVLFRYGGIYFDTDVELIRPLDDILEKGSFMGFELLGERMAVAPGLGIAAEPEMPLYKAILDRYETMSFSLPDGSLHPYTMIPMVTEILVQNGLKGNGSIEQVSGIFVYPPDWFNPYDDLTGRLKKTGNTHTIHWYAKSWMEAEPTWKAALKRAARRVLGKEFFLKLKRFS
ncbi:MAG: glycosyl transferase [Bacteroidales bacterium]|nr:glycosyl transferase [Bacteroidales bacterium]